MMDALNSVIINSSPLITSGHRAVELAKKIGPALYNADRFFEHAETISTNLWLEYVVPNIKSFADENVARRLAASAIRARQNASEHQNKNQAVQNWRLKSSLIVG